MVPRFYNNWYQCFICKQEFTGEMQLTLAHILCDSLHGREEDDEDVLDAKTNLADALDCQVCPPSVHLNGIHPCTHPFNHLSVHHHRRARRGPSTAFNQPGVCTLIASP